MSEHGVIFDLDGTLLNTLEDICDSVNASLSHFGYPTRSLEEIRRFVGNGARNLIRRSLPEGTGEETVERVLPWYDAWYRAHSLIKTTPYPGILPALTELYQKGVRMAVVSNKQDPIVKDLSARFFRRWIPVAIGERPGVRRKPAPDSVLAAMEELRIDPRYCVYVGDSETDIATAEAANLPCISVTWGFRSREELLRAGAKTILETPGELLKLS